MGKLGNNEYTTESTAEELTERGDPRLKSLPVRTSMMYSQAQSVFFRF